MKKTIKTNIKEKTTNEIFDGISDLALNGDHEMITITNIAKRSGYSIGNIYHHFKNIDDLIEKFAIARTRKRFTSIIELIDNAPSTSSAVAILKSINDANFDFLADHAPRGVFQKIAKKLFYKKSFIDGLDEVALSLVKPLEKMMKRNETDTFKKLTHQEIEMAVLMMTNAKRKPFAFNHKLAGTNSHRQQCLSIFLALLAN